MPKVSQDGPTWLLRPGVIFHDGTPFNAEAMAFSLNRFIMKNGANLQRFLADVIASVKASM